MNDLLKENDELKRKLNKLTKYIEQKHNNNVLSESLYEGLLNIILEKEITNGL